MVGGGSHCRVMQLASLCGDVEKVSSYCARNVGLF